MFISFCGRAVFGPFPFFFGLELVFFPSLRSTMRVNIRNSGFCNLNAYIKSQRTTIHHPDGSFDSCSKNMFATKAFKLRNKEKKLNKRVQLI